MISLKQVLSNKGIKDVQVASRIDSFLDLDDLKGWRATNKQAFQDVEAKVREEGMDVGSIWYHRAKHTEQCEKCGQRWSYMCNMYLKYNLDDEDLGRFDGCPDCFVKEEDVVVCVNCKNHFFGCNQSSSCDGCNTFLCSTCGEAKDCPIYSNTCNSCEHSFCKKCSKPIRHHSRHYRRGDHVQEWICLSCLSKGKPRHCKECDELDDGMRHDEDGWSYDSDL